MERLLKSWRTGIIRFFIDFRQHDARRIRPAQPRTGSLAACRVRLQAQTFREVIRQGANVTCRQSASARWRSSHGSYPTGGSSSLLFRLLPLIQVLVKSVGRAIKIDTGLVRCQNFFLIGDGTKISKNMLAGIRQAKNAVVDLGGMWQRWCTLPGRFHEGRLKQPGPGLPPGASPLPNTRGFFPQRACPARRGCKKIFHLERHFHPKHTILNLKRSGSVNGGAACNRITCSPGSTLGADPSHSGFRSTMKFRSGLTSLAAPDFLQANAHGLRSRAASSLTPQRKSMAWKRQSCCRAKSDRRGKTCYLERVTFFHQVRKGG